MERQCDLKEISDGKFYDLNDMVKVGCNDCNGCSKCCRGMGNSIVLDPLDVCRLISNLNTTFSQLLASNLQLNVVEGIILPNLKMAEDNNSCTFLNNQGRCSIHQFRPGICRIFPLGRVYDEEKFRYILQVNECSAESKTKVKVKKWIDTPDLKNNQEFISEWHYFLKNIQSHINEFDSERLKNINMYILNTFYITPFDETIDFYDQFRLRMKEAKGYCKM